MSMTKDPVWTHASETAAARGFVEYVHTRVCFANGCTCVCMRGQREYKHGKKPK